MPHSNSNQDSNPESLLKQKRVRIPFNDLTPRIQECVKKIRKNRRVRGGGELLIFIPIPRIPLLSGMIAGGMRGVASMRIQEIHREIRDRMSRDGIIRTTQEGNYPRNWINPAP